YSSFAGSIGGEKDQNASLKSPVEGELANSSESSDLRRDQVEVTGAGTVVVARVPAQAPIAHTERAARASSAEADPAQAGSPKVEAAVSAQAEHSLESVEAPPVPSTGRPQAAPGVSAGTGTDTATTKPDSASPPLPQQPGSGPLTPLQARPVSEADAAAPIQMPLPAQTPRVLASAPPQPLQMQTSDPVQSLPAQATAARVDDSAATQHQLDSSSRVGEASIQLHGDARQLADMPPATVQEVRPAVPLSPDESAVGGPLKPADVGTIPAGDGAIPAKPNAATASPAVQPEPVQSEQPASVQAPAQPLLPTRNSPLLVAGNATQEAPATSVQLVRPPPAPPPVSAEGNTRSVPVNNSSPEPDSQLLLKKTAPVTSEAAAASVVAGQVAALSGVPISVAPAGSPTSATASNKSTITTLRTEPAQHLSIAPASLAEQGVQASQVPLASGMMPATGMATMPAVNGGASVMMPGMATAPVAIAANPTTTPAPTTAAPTTAAATTAAPTTAAATTAAATTVAATTAEKEGEDEKDGDDNDGGSPEGGHNGSHEIVAVGSGRAEEAVLDNSSAEPTGADAPKAKVMGMDQQLLLTGVAAVVLIVVVPVGTEPCRLEQNTDEVVSSERGDAECLLLLLPEKVARRRRGNFRLLAEFERTAIMFVTKFSSGAGMARLSGSETSGDDLVTKLSPGPRVRPELGPGYPPRPVLSMRAQVDGLRKVIGVSSGMLLPKRKCTDRFCIVLLVAFMYLYRRARSEGDLAKLQDPKCSWGRRTHGFDWTGKICGVDEAVRDKPLLFWCTPNGEEGLTLLDGICVARCPSPPAMFALSCRWHLLLSTLSAGSSFESLADCLVLPGLWRPVELQEVEVKEFLDPCGGLSFTSWTRFSVMHPFSSRLDDRLASDRVSEQPSTDRSKLWSRQKVHAVLVGCVHGAGFANELFYVRSGVNKMRKLHCFQFHPASYLGWSRSRRKLAVSGFSCDCLHSHRLCLSLCNLALLREARLWSDCSSARCSPGSCWGQAPRTLPVFLFVSFHPAPGASNVVFDSFLASRPPDGCASQRWAALMAK
ncbi:unnamed protein product, partial [Symbiodinium sp. CCMP2456]